MQKANTTGFSIEHNQDWEKINTWISPKTNKQLVTKLNTYTRAGRCGSAWVVDRLLREYRTSWDSQTSGGNRRPSIGLLVRGICQKQEASIIIFDLMSGSSLLITRILGETQTSKLAEKVSDGCNGKNLIGMAKVR